MNGSYLYVKIASKLYNEFCIQHLVSRSWYTHTCSVILKRSSALYVTGDVGLLFVLVMSSLTTCYQILHMCRDLALYFHARSEILQDFMGVKTKVDQPRTVQYLFLD